MIKVFIGELLGEIPHTEILYPNLGNKERINPFSEKIFAAFTEPVVEIVDDPVAADYLCIPHNYNSIKNNREYISQFAGLSEEFSKKILVFFPGDSDEEVPLKNAIIFRHSQYGYKKKPNEIIMPGFAVDLGNLYGITERKKDSLSVVGFCGWAEYKNVREWLSYFFHNLASDPLHKKGLYFRRKALAVLEKSREVTTRFIIRSSYGGSTKTLELDPNATREQYVDNIKNSDFTLAPKGDGNFSVRFYESLSLGRMPLLIDTDCPLPLGDEIKYDDFILRVDHSEIPQLPARVSRFYSALSSEEYMAKQKRCREIFEKHLRIDAFFRQTLAPEFLSKL